MMGRPQELESPVVISCRVEADMKAILRRLEVDPVFVNEVRKLLPRIRKKCEYPEAVRICQGDILSALVLLAGEKCGLVDKPEGR